MDAQPREPRRDENDQRSLPRLLADFTRDTTALLQDEVALVRSEASEKIGQVSRAATSLGLGGLVLFAGVLVLLDAAVLGLAALWDTAPAWVPPLIVGGIVAVVGLILLAKGRDRIRAENLKPERTMEELRRDGKLIKERTQ